MNISTYEELFKYGAKYTVRRNFRIGWVSMKKGLTEICYRFFTNLANPTRLATLEQLMKKPMSVNEIAFVLGQEQSMISHNLKPLVQCRFVSSEKQGKQHIYSVNKETIGSLFKVIENHAKNFCPTSGKCLRGKT